MQKRLLDLKPIFMQNEYLLPKVDPYLKMARELVRLLPVVYPLRI